MGGAGPSWSSYRYRVLAPRYRSPDVRRECRGLFVSRRAKGEHGDYITRGGKVSELWGFTYWPTLIKTPCSPSLRAPRVWKSFPFGHHEGAPFPGAKARSLSLVLNPLAEARGWRYYQCWKPGANPGLQVGVWESASILGFSPDPEV